MNPWYEELVKECETAHDKECEYGPSCGDRANHIERVFVRLALKELVITQGARLAAVEKLHSEYEPFCGNPQHTNLDVGCPDCAYICAGCGEVWPCDDIKAVRGE